MNKNFLIICFQITLILGCSKENVETEEFCIAEIYGEKFQASWLYAYEEISPIERTFYLIASNSDYRDRSNIPLDYKALIFSFSNDCIAQGLYDISDWNCDSSCYWCSFEFFDSSSATKTKVITSEAGIFNGFLKIKSIEFFRDTLINGSFEIIGRNYNDLEFTDTIYIRNGSFRFKLKN